MKLAKKQAEAAGKKKAEAKMDIKKVQAAAKIAKKHLESGRCAGCADFVGCGRHTHTHRYVHIHTYQYINIHTSCMHACVKGCVVWCGVVWCVAVCGSCGSTGGCSGAVACWWCIRTYIYIHGAVAS